MTVHEALRAWARGVYATEAAVELLVHAFDGRFAEEGWSWVRTEPNGGAWIDATRLSEHHADLSGGERRVLSLVAALLDPDQPVDIGDIASGVDRCHLDLVLAAIAHAGGSHQHAAIIRDHEAGTARMIRQGSLHPWPETAAEERPRTDGAVEQLGSLVRPRGPVQM